jgi:acyl-CoA synthetase (AMP-forming)/AMP-acid ligase II
VGVPDQERGELVVAAVVPREGVETLDFVDLEGQLRKRLSSFKVPRVYVQITRDQVPMLHSNKVAKKQLQAMMVQEVAKRRGR